MAADNSGREKPIWSVSLPWPWIAGILLLTLGGAAGFTQLAVADPAAFMDLNREDGPVEILQAITLFIGAVIAGGVAIRFGKERDRVHSGLFTLLALFLFCVAMEEISWGQRVWGVETPEELGRLNRQGEINVHNLRPIQKWLFPAYVILGLGGVVLALLSRAPKLRDQYALRYMSTHPCFIPCFLPSLCYGLYRIHVGDWLALQRLYPRPRAKLISVIQEPVELWLALGFLLFAFYVWRYLKWHRYVDRPGRVPVRAG